MPLHHVYDSDHYEHGEDAGAILKVVYCRDGADAQVAKNMIAVATALLTCQYGPDEARRILRIVGEAQGKAS
jgi:hypothetical protein